jgi:hypothetical protein
VNKYTIGLALMLGLAMVAIQARAADDEDEDAKKARADILAVVKELEAGKDVAAKVDAIRKKYEDLEHLMKVYKPREKNGLGIGPKGKGDSIEFKIINMGKRKMSAGALAKEKAELIKMAYLNIVMAKITHKYVGKKKPKEWKEYTESMETESKNLLSELQKKAPSPDEIKKIATRLTASCNTCHSEIRDD